MVVQNTNVDRLSPAAARRLFTALDVDDFDVDPDLPRVDKYLLDRKLGEGAGGVVYHAVSRESRRSVALKILRRGFGDDRAAKRAWRELDVLEGVDIPQVPRVHDFGLHEGRLFIASDHIDGCSCDSFCVRGRLARRERVELLVAICRLVEAVHERGVIHRDVKPSNVLVDERGQPHLIDFGVATAGSAGVAETLTVEGTPLGTLGFMAPEQAAGAHSVVSTRSDVYGLGATAYAMLFGQIPHDIAGLAVGDALRRVAGEPARDPCAIDPDISRPLAAVLAKAVALAPADRFPSARDFADDLERWLRGEPVLSQRPSWWRNQWLAIKRRPGQYAAVAAIAGLALFGVVRSAQAVEARRVEAVWRDLQADAIRETRLALAKPDFKQAVQFLNMLTVKQHHGLIDDAETARLLDSSRDMVTALVLDAIYASERYPSSVLAAEAAQAVLRYNGAWDEDLELDLEWILLQAEMDEFREVKDPGARTEQR